MLPSAALAGGLILSETDAAGFTTSYAYYGANETEGRLDQLKSVTRGGLQVAQYKYDQFGNIDRVTDQFGIVTDYAYDALGRLLSVLYGWTDQAGDSLTSESHQYDAVGSVVEDRDALVDGRT